MVLGRLGTGLATLVVVVLELDVLETLALVVDLLPLLRNA